MRDDVDGSEFLLPLLLLLRRLLLAADFCIAAGIILGIGIIHEKFGRWEWDHGRSPLTEMFSLHTLKYLRDLPTVSLNVGPS